MKAIRKAVAVVSTYTDKQTGTEKNQYMTIGKLFERDDDSLCMKLDALPLGEFNGWINFYPLEQAQDKSAASDHTAPAAASSDLDGDIPF